MPIAETNRVGDQSTSHGLRVHVRVVQFDEEPGIKQGYLKCADDHMYALFAAAAKGDQRIWFECSEFVSDGDGNGEFRIVTKAAFHPRDI